MRELHFPWLECSLLLPVLGAAWVSRVRDPDTARWRCLIVGAAILIATTGAWIDFGTLHTFEAHDRWDATSRLSDHELLVLDEFSAPLLPLASLLYLLTALATSRSKRRRFSFASMLVSQSLLLGTLSSKDPWLIIILMALAAISPYLELRSRRRRTRIYTLHMGVFIALLTAGELLVTFGQRYETPRNLGVALTLAAVLLRSGIVPVHYWITDLFESATFGTALLYVTPMAGAYAAVRLVLPVAPDWALRSIALLSLVTAVYASGMAIVQTEARRFYCYLFLTNSALVLVGLEIVTPIGLTGALCVWISVGLSLGGFGLTLRSLEARTGRLSINRFLGLYEHMPDRGVFFLLTGLSSVGFPGTVGFIGAELLVEGVVDVYPYVGTAVVFATALNGIAVLQAYFRIFTGARHNTSLPLNIRSPEKVAILLLAALILGGGLVPQPGIASRYHAAMALIRSRNVIPQSHFDHERVVPANQ